MTSPVLPGRLVLRLDALTDILADLMRCVERFLQTVRDVLRGDARILMRNSRAVRPTYYLAVCIVVFVAVVKIVWPDDPIRTLDIPHDLRRLELLFAVIPLPLVAAAALFATLINLPMLIVSACCGYGFRSHRIVAASLYSFATVILIAPLFNIVPYVSFLAFGGEATPRSVVSVVALAAVAVLAARCCKLLGVAHGISGYRFAVLNVLVSGLAILTIHLATDSTSAWRRLASVWIRPIHAYHVPSGSMLPTVPVGAEILTNQILPAAQLRIGDIVVFRSPRDDQTMFVKRIVGRAGDRIQLKNGLLHINGQPVARERLSDASGAGSCMKDRSGEPRRWKETLPNGVSYATFDCLDNGPGDNTDVYMVPPDHVFMLGDNRSNSTDSRDLSALGYVPMANIVGKAYFVLFPFSRGYLYKAVSG